MHRCLKVPRHLRLPVALRKAGDSTLSELSTCLISAVCAPICRLEQADGRARWFADLAGLGAVDTRVSLEPLLQTCPLGLATASFTLLFGTLFGVEAIRCSTSFEIPRRHPWAYRCAAMLQEPSSSSRRNTSAWLAHGSSASIGLTWFARDGT